MTIPWVLAAAGLALVPAIGRAVPITYAMEFDVAYVTQQRDPRLAVGNEYLGFFTVDDAILQSDGINKSGNVSAFYIAMEDLIWDSNLPSPASLFGGFRGPDGFDVASPGFDVVAGEITNVRGDVFFGDDPFVDFSTSFDPSAPALPPLSNCGRYCGNVANAFWSVSPLGDFGGSMLVRRVAEPGPLALLGLGIALLIAARVSVSLRVGRLYGRTLRHVVRH